MFIELHKPEPITINLDKLEYFVPADNGWLKVEESYEQVKELIKECQMK